MKKKPIIIILLIITASIHAQMKGLTETGDEVILYNDGTWKYVSDSLNLESKIIVNDKIFSKNDESTFLVKSNKANVGIWIDPKKWTFSKGDASSPAEFTFKNKENDLYAMLISEKIELPMESLIEIALNNAKEAAQNVKVVQREYRKVNGNDLIMMQMTGSIQGIKFIYFGYYFSNSEGAFQILTYTSQNVFNQTKELMEKFLNGFVTI